MNRLDEIREHLNQGLSVTPWHIDIAYLLERLETAEKVLHSYGGNHYPGCDMVSRWAKDYFSKLGKE